MRARAESNVGWLIFILRAMRRREHFRLPGGSEGPAGGLTDDSLQTRVRERLEDGRLFLAGGASLVRRGTTRPCDVCGQAIPKHEIKHEVEQAPEQRPPFRLCSRARRLLPAVARGVAEAQAAGAVGSRDRPPILVD